MSDYYKGRRVLFSDDGDLTYWSDLFFMLESVMGPTCCMRTDSELWLHFRAVLDRFDAITQKVTQCSEISEVVTLFLAD